MMARHNEDGSVFTCLDECQPGTSFSEVVRMLEDRIVALEEIVSMDADLREKYPALQEIYEQYQTTKALVKTYGNQ